MGGRRGAGSFEDFEREVQQFTDGLAKEAGARAWRQRRRWSPSAISKRYRANKNAAVQEILEGPCPIPLEEVRRHFSAVFARADARGGAPRPEDLPPLPRLKRHAGLCRPFARGDVSAQLALTKNSTPGPDEIRFDLLKRRDGDAETLTAFFEACRRFRRTPAAWKRARTVLAFKGGDPEEPSHWRPITLCNTIYKLYAKCLAERLCAWAREGAALSPQQKGFQAGEGCEGHRFLLRSALRLARSSGRECAVAFLDLADAYGSIPRCHVFETLAEFGMPRDFLGLLRELYSGWTTTIKVRQEETGEIPLRTGLKQGCPLSPILFQLALEPLLRFVSARSPGFRLYGARVKVLAYTDDLVLVAESAAELQAMLDDATAAADWIGLRFKAGKCKSLHCVDGSCWATEFRVQGDAISCLEEGETVKYLGKPIGFQEQLGNFVGDFEDHLDKIKASQLTPGQKANMVKWTLLPRALSALRDCPVSRKDLRRVDSKVTRTLSEWNHLPTGAELTVLEQSDVEVVTHAFFLLSSPDSVVKAVAHGALRVIVHENFTQNPRRKDLASYLSGFQEDQDRYSNRSSASLWTRARYATRRLNKLVSCQWIDNGELCLELSRRVIYPEKRKNLARTLKQAVSKNKEYQWSMCHFPAY